MRFIVAGLIGGAVGFGLLPVAEAFGGSGRPTEPGASGPYGSAYTVPDHSPPHCTDHVCVHWVETTDDAPDLTDSDGNGVPNYVEAAAGAFELSRFRQHAAAPDGLAWRLPKSDGTRGGGSGQVDAYVMELGPRRLGVGPADYDSCAEDGCSGYIVLGRALSPDHLKEITAHEYNHVVQYTYDRFAASWLSESTATWVSVKAHPEVTTWLRFVTRWAGVTEQHLMNDTAEKKYGSAVWNLWLDRRYGSGLIRNVWERTPGDMYGNDRTLEAYDAAIRERGGGGFEDEFTRFSAAMPEWRLASSGFPHSPAYADVERVATLTPGAPTEVTLPGVTFALLDIPPTSAASIRLQARLPQTAGAIALVGREGDAASGTATTVFESLPSGGEGGVVLEAPGRFQRITAVLINARWIPGPSPTATAAISQTLAPGDDTAAASGTEPATAPKMDRTAPRIAIRTKPRISLASLLRTGVALRARSSEPGRLTARLAIRRRGGRTPGRATIGVIRRTLRSQTSTRLVLEPSRRGQTPLARRRPPRIMLTVSVTDRAGNTRTVRRSISVISRRPGASTR